MPRYTADKYEIMVRRQSAKDGTTPISPLTTHEELPKTRTTLAFAALVNFRPTLDRNSLILVFVGFNAT